MQTLSYKLRSGPRRPPALGGPRPSEAPGPRRPPSEAPHFSPFQWSVRNNEATIVAEKVKACLQNNQPVIVMGDLNANSPKMLIWSLKTTYAVARQAMIVMIMYKT